MEFDYVIAGGGSAGATLAARLSENPKTTVCLLEAGGDGRHLFIRTPVATAVMLSGRPRISNWAFATVPQAALGGRVCYQPRGKALGGSSAGPIPDSSSSCGEPKAPAARITSRRAHTVSSRRPRR